MLGVKDAAVTSSTLLSVKDLNDEHSLPGELLRMNIQYLGKYFDADAWSYLSGQGKLH